MSAAQKQAPRHTRSHTHSKATTEQLHHANSTKNPPPTSNLLNSAACKSPETPNESHRVHIVLSNATTDLVGHNISWAMLVHYCGKEHVRSLIARHPHAYGQTFLVLPAAECEPIGVQTVLAWMQRAYYTKAKSVLSHSSNEDLLTFCCAERALHVLGIRRDGKVLRSSLNKQRFRSDRMSAELLKSIWDTFPRNSHWAERVLDCVQEGIVFMQEYKLYHKECYCGSYDFSYNTHKNCLGEWLTSDATLQDGIGQFINSRGPHLQTIFAKSSKPLKKALIGDWVMQVEAVQYHARNRFPSSTAPFGVVRQRIEIRSQRGPLGARYQLEFVEAGEYYVETEAAPVDMQLRTSSPETTAVGRAWHTSRKSPNGGASGAKSEVHNQQLPAQPRAAVIPAEGVKDCERPLWL